MEKIVKIRNTELTFSIWDMSGNSDFRSMLPLVLNQAVAILFVFDLCNRASLNSIKEWYRTSRWHNRSAVPLLVGTKYDRFVELEPQLQQQISTQARKYARAMKAPLVFTSACYAVNIKTIFKLVVAKTMGLRCSIPQVSTVGEPLVLYWPLT